MKNVFNGSICYALLLFTFISCSKRDSFEIIKRSAQPPAIAETKQWFEQKYPQYKNNHTVLWNKADVFTFSSGNIIVGVPLKKKNEKDIKLNKLIFTKEKNTAGIHVVRMIANPTKEYFEARKGLISEKDFSGDLMLFDLQGKYIKGVRMKQGKQIGNLELSKNKSAGNWNEALSIRDVKPGRNEDISNEEGGGGDEDYKELPEVIVTAPSRHPDNNAGSSPSFPWFGSNDYYFPPDNSARPIDEPYPFGGGVHYEQPDLDPWSDDNNLPLPCEPPADYSKMDTIIVHEQRVREAFKFILPPEYCAYVQFDGRGRLDKAKLLSAKNQPGMPASDLYDALVTCVESKFDIEMYFPKEDKDGWKGKLTKDTVMDYEWDKDLPNNEVLIMEGITVVPGTAVTIPGAPVTNDPNIAKIFIRKATVSSNKRIALLIVHELLGHMHEFIKKRPFTHGNKDFEKWRSAIEKKANKNWKLIKKFKKVNDECFK